MDGGRHGIMPLFKGSNLGLQVDVLGGDPFTLLVDTGSGNSVVKNTAPGNASLVLSKTKLKVDIKFDLAVDGIQVEWRE